MAPLLAPLTLDPTSKVALFLLVRRVEAMGIEPTNLLHAMQALYQLSYAPGVGRSR